MNYAEMEHIEDMPPFSILKSPVGGHWVVSFTPDGRPIFKHYTRTIVGARRVVTLERQIIATLRADCETF